MVRSLHPLVVHSNIVENEREKNKKKKNIPSSLHTVYPDL